ncbi:RNA polymerase sigma factor [Bremerella cremea]|uniref:RNA polymerase subunit sigma-24 n=1 Tax=Blastopirellula marina TaxID=124 RepID=A0A2S8G5X6_9BACT|nr:MULTISPECIES: RNA polymerase sigma factor [Pirellulaceae]PQO39849.1 RNA polymerase subunit sigma-24 [Blastopirellula marina]RCS51315.1 RNA polymerase sigma factor [Bremerella cremea]
MVEEKSREVRQMVDELYRQESRRVFATLVRLLGDFDLAEEAMHEAFTSAVEKWHEEGIPNNPRAWLVSTGRFKAIDTIRRRVRFDQSLGEIAQRLGDGTSTYDPVDDENIEDDRLRLIFMCCHPAIASSAQVALTLREVCGLRTEEIASAFLTSPPTIAQRIVRGKAKIRDAGIPFEIPTVSQMPQRMDAVLSVIYLVFNEGYSASSGDKVTRRDLSEEAIRLGRLLVQHLPDAEAKGLLGLMLIQESRRAARTTLEGDIVLLEDQDRSLWNQAYIAEGSELIQQALASRRFGIYSLQAAIAAVHAEASSPEETDWTQIIALYDVLAIVGPSPIVDLNRAVAVAMRDGPETGLPLIEAILEQGTLSQYHLAHAAKADLCRRLGRKADAKHAYEKALELARQEPERRFLERRIQELA